MKGERVTLSPLFYLECIYEENWNHRRHYPCDNHCRNLVDEGEPGGYGGYEAGNQGWLYHKRFDC